MFAYSLSTSIHNMYLGYTTPKFSSYFCPVPSSKLKGYQSPGAYVKWNFISMKVKESFTFHLKYFTMCSNYSTPFSNRSWSGYTLLLICFQVSCFYNKPFIESGDTVYMLRKALTCIFLIFLFFLYS